MPRKRYKPDGLAAAPNVSEHDESAMRGRTVVITGARRNFEFFLHGVFSAVHAHLKCAAKLRSARYPVSS